MQIVQIRKRFPLIIALACGIWAILLLNIYIARERSKFREEFDRKLQQIQPPQPPPVMGVVLVAGKDISPQVPITHTDLVIKEMPVEYIQPQAVTSLEGVIGKISSVPIVTGEQILKNKLLPPGRIGKSLSEITPEGKRAVTVAVDNVSSVLNLIRPGDFVDVFAVITLPPTVSKSAEKDSGPKLFPLFQNIEVLAVGTEFIDLPPDASEADKEQAKAARAASSTVTLAVNPQEAVLLSFVQENGKIKLVLRAQEDARQQPIKSGDWDTLLRYISPDTVPEIESKGPASVVEIYRGVSKEVIPLSRGEK